MCSLPSSEGDTADRCWDCVMNLSLVNGGNQDASFKTDIVIALWWVTAILLQKMYYPLQWTCKNCWSCGKVSLSLDSLKKNFPSLRLLCLLFQYRWYVMWWDVIILSFASVSMLTPSNEGGQLFFFFFLIKVKERGFPKLRSQYSVLVLWEEIAGKATYWRFWEK